jgi:hypothetical protein
VNLPAILEGRDRYERVMEGWIDNLHPDTLTHTVRLATPDLTVEATVDARPSPTYVVEAARCHAVTGLLAPSVAAGFAKLSGVPMTGGFTRRVSETTGPGAGAALVLEAAIEVARLARQVAKLPRERAERAAAGDPRECWGLDVAGFADLPDSCFTYSVAGRALFGTRPVSAAAYADLYSPRPGQRRVFERRKVARLERTDGLLRLFHAMHDNVHGFELTYEVDLASGTIVRADSLTPRLPYAGICSEPQARISALVGETLDAGLRRRIGALIGGASGCAQLYDLTADLLRLLA